MNEWVDLVDNRVRVAVSDFDRWGRFIPKSWYMQYASTPATLLGKLIGVTRGCALEIVVSF